MEGLLSPPEESWDGSRGLAAAAASLVKMVTSNTPVNVYLVCCCCVLVTGVPIVFYVQLTLYIVQGYVL